MYGSVFFSSFLRYLPRVHYYEDTARVPDETGKCRKDKRWYKLILGGKHGAVEIMKEFSECMSIE